MNIKNAFIAVAAIVAARLIVPSVQAQRPQGGPGGHGGGPPGGGPPGGDGHPVIAALDADQNHELSAEEIANATKVLSALDKNGDGKLNEEDLGQIGPRGGHDGGPGRPGGRERGHGGHSAADSDGQDSEFASRLMAFDKNENGKVEKDELPARMQRVLENLDKNKDDALDSSELAQINTAAAEASSGKDRGGRGGRGKGGDHGAREERGSRGGREGRADRGSRGERGGRGEHRGQSGSPGGGGEQMIDHAFEFDKDGDGKLSREELKEFAASMPQPGGGGPGGRGGPPGGGRGR